MGISVPSGQAQLMAVERHACFRRSGVSRAPRPAGRAPSSTRRFHSHTASWLGTQTPRSRWARRCSRSWRFGRCGPPAPGVQRVFFMGSVMLSPPDRVMSSSLDLGPCTAMAAQSAVMTVILASKFWMWCCRCARSLSVLAALTTSR